MIVLVEAEHPARRVLPAARRLFSQRVRIKYLLEDLSGDECLLVRYEKVTPALLDRLDARAVFISGQGADFEEYDDDAFGGLFDAITAGDRPVFGLCGGMQLLAWAFGEEPERIGPLAAGEEDPFPDYVPGWRKEVGYLPVEVIAEHPVLAGMTAPVVRQAHSWEIKRVPAGFVNLARTGVTEVQCIAHESRPLVGTQFHPEYGTDEHPAGTEMLANFLSWAGVAPPHP